MRAAARRLLSLQLLGSQRAGPRSWIGGVALSVVIFGRLSAVWRHALGPFLALSVVLPGATAAAESLDPETAALMESAFQGLGTAPIVDVHVHLVALNAEGAYVSPGKLSPARPLEWLKTRLYLRASGVKDLARFDEAYVERLLQRADGFPRPFRFHLLAMDYHYGKEGRRDLAHTEFYVPNELVVSLAERYPERIVPVVSVHPYRRDALEELDRWAARGVRFVKWLPNAQGMDPSDSLVDPFYARMKRHGMVLLSHAGEEKAVHARSAQALGNPLKLRHALDAGVRVIVAHCASLGRNEDLDRPGRTASNFDLFLRLMSEERYRGLLFGDISAITQVNRMPGPLRTVLGRPDLQERLVNGSDYPLPGIPLLTLLQQFVHHGFVTKSEARALANVFKSNPLLADFLLKRTIRDPASGRSLDPRIFTSAALLGAPSPSP